MNDFKRARSPQNKELRMNEIKQATDELFSSNSYHEITLTSITAALGWPRTTLYKYVSSKEEIFLKLLCDKQHEYFTSLKSAFPLECKYSSSVAAEVWASILTSHRDYLNYNSILSTIIETNVSLELLTEYKRNFFSDITILVDHFSKYWNITPEDSQRLSSSIQFFASGLNNSCNTNPLAQEAARLAGIPPINIDFKDNLQDFIHMCIKYYTES